MLVIALISLLERRTRLALVQGTGFVLRICKFAESDLIVTLFTDKWGKRTAIAKQARRLSSRIGGVFDLLNQVEIVFYEKPGLDLISQGSLIQGFLGLKSNLKTVSVALSVGRLLNRLLPPCQPERQVYALFSLFLKMLDSGDVPMDHLKIAFTMKALTLLGHRPHLNSCLKCDATTDSFSFIAHRGGVLCSKCSQGRGIPVSRGLLLSLESLLRFSLPRAGVVHLSLKDIQLTNEILTLYADFISP